MRKKTRAFTLVELIVVITILAVLGTIAFISLQGYAQRAKNSKISQDINALASAVEIGITNGSITHVTTLVRGDLSGHNGVSTGSTMTLYDDNNVPSIGILDNTSIKYSIGKINFQALRQSSNDFKDSDGNDYIIATAVTGSTAYYQLGGQQIANSGEYIATIKGNYYPQAGDTLGLISASGSQNPVINNENLGIIEQNTNLY